MVAVSSTDFNDQRFIVPPGQYTGVVLLESKDEDGGACTGVLLKGVEGEGDGLYILTAAHCFCPGDSVTASFDLPDGNGNKDTKINVEKIFVHPEYNPSNGQNDIAILKLSEKAPPGVELYEMYRGDDEVGRIFTLVGYGTPGTGEKGEEVERIDEPFLKRFGQNIYDDLGDRLGELPEKQSNILEGRQLAYDFDNGKEENDFFGRQYNLNQLGVDQEVNSTRGDSGGPTFIDNKIAGIVSYGASSSQSEELMDKSIADIDDNLANASFGEYSVDTRISKYADWIEQITRGGNGLTIPGNGSSFNEIKLTENEDYEIGTARADSIEGKAGRDRIFGNQGNDILLGGPGNDSLWGGRNNDVLFGNEQQDILYGNRENDSLYGCLGDDCLFGGKGNDILYGGEGNDTLVGDRNSDILVGGLGKDLFILKTDGLSLSEADIIIDYNFNLDNPDYGKDQIGLINGLNRDDLKPESIVVDGQGGVVISLKNNPEDVLGIVLGVGLEEFQEIEFTEKLGLKPPPFRGTFDFVYIV